MLSFLSVLAILLFLFPRPVRGFGRRGSSNAAEAKPKSIAREEHWSSTGSRGLDHNAPEDEKVLPVKNKSPDDIDHPYRAWFEHHPYGSGVFTMDAKFYED